MFDVDESPIDHLFALSRQPEAAEHGLSLDADELRALVAEIKMLQGYCDMLESIEVELVEKRVALEERVAKLKSRVAKLTAKREREQAVHLMEVSGWRKRVTELECAENERLEEMNLESARAFREGERADRAEKQLGKLTGESHEKP